MSVTQPLRDEHRELLPRLGSLRVAAEAARGRDGLRGPLDEALAFLEGQLIPHAQAGGCRAVPEGGAGHARAGGNADHAPGPR